MDSTHGMTWPSLHLQAAYFAVSARGAGAGMAGHQSSRGHPRKVLVVQQKCCHLPHCPLARPHAPAQPLLQAPEPSLQPQINPVITLTNQCSSMQLGSERAQDPLQMLLWPLELPARLHVPGLGSNDPVNATRFSVR